MVDKSGSVSTVCVIDVEGKLEPVADIKNNYTILTILFSSYGLVFRSYGGISTKQRLFHNHLKGPRSTFKYILTTMLILI